MPDVSISKFRKNCSRLIKQVSHTKKALCITHRGRPLAEVIPAQRVRKRFALCDMIGTAEIVGEIVSPVISLDEIEAYRDSSRSSGVS